MYFWTVGKMSRWSIWALTQTVSTRGLAPWRASREKYISFCQVSKKFTLSLHVTVCGLTILIVSRCAKKEAASIFILTSTIFMQNTPECWVSLHIFAYTSLTHPSQFHSFGTYLFFHYLVLSNPTTSFSLSCAFWPVLLIASLGTGFLQGKNLHWPLCLPVHLHLHSPPSIFLLQPLLFTPFSFRLSPSDNRL